MSWPNSFATERLRAERLTADHFDDLVRMHLNPPEMKWIGGVRDEAKTRAYLEKNLDHWHKHGFGIWMLRDASNALIGRGLLRTLPLDGVDEIELGYGLAPSHWGRGLATELTKKLIELGYRELAAPSIVALTHQDNLGSRRVLEKCGLHHQRDLAFEGAPYTLYRIVP
jgi:[ribosomal protein S5]-alanine N-acetyltransferase